MEEYQQGRPLRDSAREKERRRLLPQAPQEQGQQACQRSKRDVKDVVGCLITLAKKLRSPVPLQTPKVFLLRLRKADFGRPQPAPGPLRKLRQELSEPCHGALQWWGRPVEISPLWCQRLVRLSASGASWIERRSTGGQEGQLQKTRGAKGTSKSDAMERQGQVSAVRDPVADRVITNLCESPGTVWAGSSWLGRVHVARVFEVESCGAPQPLQGRLALLFTFPRVQTLVRLRLLPCFLPAVYCKEVARHVLDAWAGAEDPLPQLARRVLHQSLITGDKQNTTRFVAYPLLPCERGLGTSRPEQRWRSLAQGTRFSRFERFCCCWLSRVSIDYTVWCLGSVRLFTMHFPAKYMQRLWLCWQERSVSSSTNVVEQWRKWTGGKNCKLAPSATTGRKSTLKRICAALPPARTGGLVNAADVSTGFVREALLDPSFVLKTNTREDEPPSRPYGAGPRCGLARARSGTREQKHLRTHRVQRKSRGKRTKGAGRSDWGREGWQRSQHRPSASHHEHQSVQQGSTCHQWRHVAAPYQWAVAVLGLRG